MGSGPSWSVWRRCKQNPKASSPLQCGRARREPRSAGLPGRSLQKGGYHADAVLSGHAHNYQRYTQRVNLTGQAMEIPFLVAGCGGHNDLPVPLANGQARGDHSFDKAMGCYGYLTVTVSPHRLQIDMTQVTATGATPFDTVAVDLDTHRPV